MSNKYYEKTKRFIKTNGKVLLIYIVFLFICLYPLDYEVYTPGGLISLNDRLDIVGLEEKGDFNLTYVGAKKGTIPIILLSFIIPSWDIVSIDEMRISDESYNDIVARGGIDLASVNQNAIIVAFEKAKQEYKIISTSVAVYFIFDNAVTNLKVGDIITEIEGQKVTDLDFLKNEIMKNDVGTKVNFKVLRNGKNETAYGTIIEENGEKIVGLYLQSILEVETNPKVEFNYKDNENGSSGGLMSALQIYNSLIDEDITKGSVISGTGTIELDGTVGEIAGIKYKLAGAVRKKADVFIAPKENYEEAIKLKKEKNYDIEIIEADTFDNVVEKLKSR